MLHLARTAEGFQAQTLSALRETTAGATAVKQPPLPHRAVQQGEGALRPLDESAFTSCRRRRRLPSVAR